MSRPGSETAPPGEICHPCTDGTLKVKVYLQMLCWDTDLTLGTRSPDRPFNGVEVSISGPTSAKPQLTAGNGEVTFTGLTPGSYDVTVTKKDFTDETKTITKFPPDITPDKLNNSHNVASRATTEAVRVMRRSSGLRCTRKHATKVGGAPGPRRIVLPILWLGNDEPWVMILRDTLWLAALVTMAIALAMGNLALGAWCAAFAAYLTTVIFGQGAGRPVMAVAFVGYVAMLAVSIAALALSYLGLPKPNPLWLGAASAVWGGFGWALARGRREEYFNSKPLEIIIAGVIGLALALVLFLTTGGSLGSPQGFWPVTGAVVVGVLIAALGFASGALGGLFSHTFTNEGEVQNPRWHSQTDYLLPFVGEHYCVQGLRGFISHTGDQEYAYDWEFPLGTPILASKEGHIVHVKEDEDGALGMNILGLFRILGTGNDVANEIHVEHRDESVAEYLHLRLNGVTEIDARIPIVATTANPLHVHAGHRLAGAGNVGISMFSHLHFMVKYKPGTADKGELNIRRPVKFQDGDTASHGNRCFSMRKYVSANVDRGVPEVPDDDPPLNPGGTPTDGKAT
jgi:murein DD-endopeptidase MepM/ murein hydrolase activator NlpD